MSHGKPLEGGILKSKWLLGKGRITHSLKRMEGGNTTRKAPYRKNKGEWGGGKRGNIGELYPAGGGIIGAGEEKRKAIFYA